MAGPLGRFSSSPRVYSRLAEDLYGHGIRTVFGLMSDDTAVLITELEGRGVRFVSARHENNAIVMGEGFASKSDGLGRVRYWPRPRRSQLRQRHHSCKSDSDGVVGDRRGPAPEQSDLQCSGS